MRFIVCCQQSDDASSGGDIDLIPKWDDDIFQRINVCQRFWFEFNFDVSLEIMAQNACVDNIKSNCC